MIIGLVGYHSSGKSDLCRYLEKRFGWRWILKRTLLKEWSGLGEDEPAWTEWYRDLYRTLGDYEIMCRILARIAYKRNISAAILIDAVHSPGEWCAIKDTDPDSLLAGVFAPNKSRINRSSPEDVVLDKNRERHWHGGVDVQCLLSQIEWSFCGIATPELRDLEAQALFNYLVIAGKIS